MEKVLVSPFRSGATHIVIFRPIFPDRAVPGWTQKRHHRADGAAEKGNKTGCGERKPCHMTPHAKRGARICQCSRALVGSELRAAQPVFGRPKRIPRSSISRSMRCSLDLAMASIMFLKKPLTRLNAVRTPTRFPRVLPNV